MVNYDELIKKLSRTDEPFGLLTMQATSTTSRLMKVFPSRLKALYAAEHGFFGTTATGELNQGSYHPFFNLPIHSLYGEFRKPTPEMLSSIKRMVIDLCDIGVRCYSYLATLKYTLEACAENGVRGRVRGVLGPDQRSVLPRHDARRVRDLDTHRREARPRP